MNPVLPGLAKAATFMGSGCAFAFVVAVAADPAAAAAPATLRATLVINQVSLQSGAAVTVNQPLEDGSAVRTGANARAEMTSASGGITRLGAKTSCHFDASGRRLTLDDGAILFEVPARSFGVKVKTGGLTVSTKGSTGILERHGDAYVKLLVLAGTARVYLSRIGESVLVEAGQILISKPDAKLLPEPAHFDIERLYRTSVLTSDDFAPLATGRQISRAMQKQRGNRDFARTNLVIYGRGTVVSLLDPPAPRSAPPKRSARAPAPLSAAKSRQN